MTPSLDVMVIEARRGAATAAVDALEAAGHRALTCQEPDAPAFPCRAVTTPGDCPLAAGPDVALVVRPRVAPEPTAREAGVACALRAGVPLVEAGPSILDPYEPWLAGRARDDVVGACEAAADAALDDLRRRIMTLVRPVLAIAGVPAPPSVCQIHYAGPRLRVHFELAAPVSDAVRNALGVRVLDAVRAGNRTFGTVDVSVSGGAGEALAP